MSNNVALLMSKFVTPSMKRSVTLLMKRSARLSKTNNVRLSMSKSVTRLMSKFATPSKSNNVRLSMNKFATLLMNRFASRFATAKPVTVVETEAVLADMVALNQPTLDMVDLNNNVVKNAGMFPANSAPTSPGKTL